VHAWLVDHLATRDGARVLEIAAGPGDTGFLAARRIGTGRLVSTDIAPAMVRAARARGAELGIVNAAYRELDAQAMDLPNGAFDGVLCRWGFMLMPDPAAALRESRRVLAPGGRLVFAVFTGPEENPFASIPLQVMVAQGHRPARSTWAWDRGICALGDRARLQALLDGAGFASTHVEAVAMTWTFPTADAYWHFLVELTALGPALRALSDASRVAVRAAIDEHLMSFTNAGGIALPSRCWCGVAQR
jgi:SAM-dependent methyltransferase